MTPHPTREEKNKRVDDIVKKAEKEFEDKFNDLFSYIESHAGTSARHDAKAFLASKLKEIATTTLAACEVEGMEVDSSHNERAKNEVYGWNAAVKAQKKKAEEWMI